MKLFLEYDRERRVYKLLIGKWLMYSLSVALAGSLLVGLICWQLSGEFIMRYFIAGAGPGLCFLLFPPIIVLASRLERKSKSSRRKIGDREKKINAFFLGYIMPGLIAVLFIMMIIDCIEQYPARSRYFGWWAWEFFLLAFLIFQTVMYLLMRAGKFKKIFEDVGDKK